MYIVLKLSNSSLRTTNYFTKKYVMDLRKQSKIVTVQSKIDPLGLKQPIFP